MQMTDCFVDVQGLGLNHAVFLTNAALRVGGGVQPDWVNLVCDWRHGHSAGPSVGLYPEGGPSLSNASRRDVDVFLSWHRAHTWCV